MPWQAQKEFINIGQIQVAADVPAYRLISRARKCAGLLTAKATARCRAIAANPFNHAGLGGLLMMGGVKKLTNHGFSRLSEPLIYQPIGVGMKKGEPVLLAMDKAGEINPLWNKWLGPNTEYKMVREDKVVPLISCLASFFRLPIQSMPVLRATMEIVGDQPSPGACTAVNTGRLPSPNP